MQVSLFVRNNSTSIYGRTCKHLNARIYLTQQNTKLAELLVSRYNSGLIFLSKGGDLIENRPVTSTAFGDERFV